MECDIVSTLDKLGVSKRKQIFICAPFSNFVSMNNSIFRNP